MEGRLGLEGEESDLVKIQKPLMSWSEMLYLVSGGCRGGCHGSIILCGHRMPTKQTYDWKKTDKQRIFPRR